MRSTMTHRTTTPSPVTLRRRSNRNIDAVALIQFSKFGELRHVLLVNRSQSVSHIVSYRLFNLIHMVRRVWHAILAIWLHYWTNPIYLSWQARSCLLWLRCLVLHRRVGRHHRFDRYHRYQFSFRLVNKKVVHMFVDGALRRNDWIC